MRIFPKISVILLAATLALGLSAAAVDMADPERAAELPRADSAAPAAEFAVPSDVPAPIEADAETPTPIEADDAKAAPVEVPQKKAAPSVTKKENPAPAASDPEAKPASEEKSAGGAVAAKPAPAVKKFSLTRDSIRLDGVAVTPAGYNINDENYFKLRDIAYLMNGKPATFAVGYDEKTNSITLKTGEAYQPDGKEMMAGTAKPKISPSTAKVLLNGKPVAMTAYNINGNNYFRLRDIGSQIGFDVGYVDKTVTLKSGPAVTYTVTFNMNGQGAQLAPVTVGENAKIPAQEAPAVKGYLFGGWFRDSECKTAWDFAAGTARENITLYAKWTKTYTVSFGMNGQGSQTTPITNVPSGAKITAPKAPSASGSVFTGWFRDSACKTAWDFAADTVSQDITLYAKWSHTFTMTYNLNGHGAAIAPQSGIVSDTFAKAPAAPSASGFTFGGWFIESSCSTPWVFNVDKVTQDITVYASWTDNATGMVPDDDLLPDNSATPPAPTPAPPTRPDNASAIDGKLTILLDPGHGGTDSGATGHGMQENSLNLEVAKYLQEMLQGAGVNVIMSRESTATTLYGVARKNYVLDACSKGNIDLVLSIHHNSFNGRTAGAEVLTQSSSQDPNGTSKELARLILAEYKKTGQVSRGVTNGSGKYMVSAPATYGVTAVLSEFCFLDNAADAAKIDSAEERRAEAQALYNAVMKYYETHDF